MRMFPPDQTRPIWCALGYKMLVAFDELLDRLDNFAVADEDGITILPNILLRGVTRLPITFTRKA